MPSSRYSLAETSPTPSLPPQLGSYTRMLLVSQDRRHLLVTLCVLVFSGVITNIEVRVLKIYFFQCYSQTRKGSLFFFFYSVWYIHSSETLQFRINLTTLRYNTCTIWHMALNRNSYTQQRGLTTLLSIFTIERYPWFLRLLFKDFVYCACTKSAQSETPLTTRIC